MTVRWQPIETAPWDGTIVRILTNSVEGLPEFETEAAYDHEYGWCVCELRQAAYWKPLNSRTTPG